MELEKGQVICSRAGHDKGRLMLIVGFDAGRLLLCDGKLRPLEKPKHKNPIHVTATEQRLDVQTATNRSLRKALNAMKAEGTEGR